MMKIRPKFNKTVRIVYLLGGLASHECHERFARLGIWNGLPAARSGQKH